MNLHTLKNSILAFALAGGIVVPATVTVASAHAALTLGCTLPMSSNIVSCELSGRGFHPRERLRITYRLTYPSLPGHGGSTPSSSYTRRAISDQEGAFRRPPLRFAFSRYDQFYRLKATAVGFTGDRASTTIESLARNRNAAGWLVVAKGRGGLGERGPIQGQIVLVHAGRVVRVLTRESFNFSGGGMAPSPDGSFVVYSAGPERLGHGGLWIVRSDGTGARRIVATGNPDLTVSDVSWSTGGRLAYVISNNSGLWGAIGNVVMPAPWPDVLRNLRGAPVGVSRELVGPVVGNGNDGAYQQSVGIWVAHINPGGHQLTSPHRVARPSQVLVCPKAAGYGRSNLGPLGYFRVRPLGKPDCEAGSVSSLSWSSDGKTLVASVSRLQIDALVGGLPSNFVETINVANGKVKVLVPGAGDSGVSPTTGELTYVVFPSSRRGRSRLWIADAAGRHRRRLLSAQGLIRHPQWSPDGRSIAYIADGGAISLVDLATRRTQIILRADAKGQQLFPKGYFLDLGWM